MRLIDSDVHICVVGLGYVGLPLAVEFGKYFKTTGYDIDYDRIVDLNSGIDQTGELTKDEILGSKHLVTTNDQNKLDECNIYVLALPTPINEFNVPDFSPLIDACKLVGSNLSKGNIVIFESTVYPGATEEICVPVLMESSNLVYNKDFYIGYSPERINPSGDKKLVEIIKVTSGSTKKVSHFIDELYKKIITAGTYLAPSIKIAEAAKILENTQRDLNIAFINQVAIFFHALDINTIEVIKAARTKWNFLEFTPGLVGGHCIGVDPYYLLHKANQHGIDLNILRAGRGINDQMGYYVAEQVILLMAKKNISIHSSKVLILGITFKENCSDIRNSRVIDIINKLKTYNINVDVFDPIVSTQKLFEMHGITTVDKLKSDHYDGVVVAVPHREFLDYDEKFYKEILKKNNVFYDLKGVYHNLNFSDGEL